MFQAIKTQLARVYDKGADAFLKASVVVATAAGGAANAQTDPFDTVVATVTGKVEDYAGALVVLAGIGIVFMVGIKYLKKIRGAA